jgi:hypothetical protein
MDKKFSISHRMVGSNRNRAIPQGSEATNATTNYHAQSFLRKWTETNHQRGRPRSDFPALNKGKGLRWQRIPKTPCGILLVLTAFLLFVMTTSHSRLVRRFGSIYRPLRGSRLVETVQIAFRDVSYVRPPTNRTSIVSPTKLRRADDLQTMLPDFGGLVIRIPEDESKRLDRRVIQHDFQHDLLYRNLISGPNDDDDVEGYYAFDDDNARNPLLRYDDHEIHKTKRCRRTNWHRSLFNTCLTFHEYDTLTRFRSNELQYVS